MPCRYFDGAQMKTLIAFVLSIPSMLPFAYAQNDQSWPRVQSFAKEWHIPDAAITGADTPVLAYIRDVKGVPIYKLECHSGDYDNGTEINFSGTFQCALFAWKGGRNASWNLLADRNHQDSDWDNRGRMLAQQLNATCGGWAEYGTHRTFQLRGMDINFVFKNLQWKPSGGREALGTFTFAVQVRNDPKSITPQADVVKVSQPPSSCEW